MDTETIGFMPAIELAELIRTKKLSPVECLRITLDRIAELEPKLNIMQIVGKRFDDLDVLRAAAAFEELQPWANKRPPL